MSKRSDNKQDSVRSLSPPDDSKTELLLSGWRRTPIENTFQVGDALNQKRSKERKW